MEYDVSDYGIFTDAIGTVGVINGKINDAQSKIAELNTILSDGSVFMGPIADSCSEALNDLNINMTTMMNNFSTISKYLESTSSEYQLGDENASSTILELDYNNFRRDTLIVAQTVSKTVSNGKSSVATTTYNNPSGISGSHLDFINSIVGGAVASYNEYGVLPSVTIAQAILESGWGKSAIGNNIFGIKAGSNWTGKTQNVLTGEQSADGSYYNIYANFRDYDSIDDSIKDHGKLFTQDFYRPVIEATNYADACRAVQNCGYATAHNYADSLINIIESYGLDQWDPK